MTNTELKHSREILYYLVTEAAKYLGGGVDERTWRRWERGHNPVPQNVVENVMALLQWRQDLIDNTIEAGKKKLKHYPDIESYLKPRGHKPEHYKPYISACGHLVHYGIQIV